MTQPTEKSACCSSKQQVNAAGLSSPMPESTLFAQPLDATKKVAGTIPSVVLSVLIAFFPKCPVCWAIYMSMFGSLGLAKLPYMSWLLPVLLLFLGLNLFLLYRKARQRGYLPFLVSLCGAVLLIGGRFFLPSERWLLVTGMSLIISGSLLNGLATIRLPLAVPKNIA